MEKKKWLGLKKAGISLLTFLLAAGILSQPALADRDHRGDDDDGWENSRVYESVLPAKVKGHPKFFFEDVWQAEWAFKSIIKMAGQGIFVGNGKGYFMPNRAITRAEAVVAAVRLMGKEEEAKAKGDVQLLFKDSKLIDLKFGWAEGYIAVALESGLFDSNMDSFQPEKPATREWVATLLVRALGLESEALAKMNTPLHFQDARAISAAAVGYVAVAVEKGLIQGFPNGTFQPHKPITRAEMATLLDRMDWLDEEVISGVQGVISSVSPDGLSFEVKKANGDLVRVTLDGDSYLYLDGRLIRFADLKPDLRVTVIYDKDGTVLLVDLRTTGIPGDMEMRFQGNIDELTLPGAGGVGMIKLDLGDVNKTFTLTKETVVKTEGLPLDLSDLKVNQKANVRVKNQVALEIKVEGQVAVKNGTLVEVKPPSSSENGALRLRVSEEVYESFALAPQFYIDEGGTERSLSDLKVGDEVRLTTFNQQVKRVNILAHLANQYQGKIRSIFMIGTNAAGSISVELEDGRILTLKLDPQAEVILNGKIKTIRDLAVGGKVMIKVQGDTVIQIVG